jgi:hypothetical protein
MNQLAELIPTPLSALVLVQPDSAMLADRVLRTHAFEITQICEASSALELCRHRRFDLGVYDDSVQGAMELAGDTRFSSLPRVSIGLLKNATRAFPRLNFVLPKPLNTEVLSKTVKAALAPIAVDRRQSFRHYAHIDVESCVLLHSGGARALSGVTVVNLSLTGLCLQAAEMLLQGATVELAFALPSTQFNVCLSGRVVWTHASGRAGIKLMHVHRDDQRRLEDWVDGIWTAPIER